MRKKELIAQNLALFEENEKLHKKITDLEAQVSRLLEMTNRATENNKNNILSSGAVPISPIVNLQNTVLSRARNSVEEYGARAIGKIVLLASGVEETKDITDKTEAFKETILNIVSDNAPFDEKILKIDGTVSAASDFFENI